MPTVAGVHALGPWAGLMISRLQRPPGGIGLEEDAETRAAASNDCAAINGSATEA
jgi:hypothetical protein